MNLQALATTAPSPPFLPDCPRHQKALLPLCQSTRRSPSLPDLSPATHTTLPVPSAHPPPPLPPSPSHPCISTLTSLSLSARRSSGGLLRFPLWVCSARERRFAGWLLSVLCRLSPSVWETHGRHNSIPRNNSLPHIMAIPTHNTDPNPNPGPEPSTNPTPTLGPNPTPTPPPEPKPSRNPYLNTDRHP